MGMNYLGSYNKIYKQRLWNHNTIYLPLEAKALYLAILNYSSTSPIGTIINPENINSVMRLKPRKFHQAMQTLIDKKLVKMSETSDLLWIVNFVQFNLPETPQAVKSWAGAINECYNSPLKNEIIKHLGNICELLGQSFLNEFERFLTSKWRELDTQYEIDPAIKAEIEREGKNYSFPEEPYILANRLEEIAEIIEASRDRKTKKSSKANTQKNQEDSSNFGEGDDDDETGDEVDNEGEGDDETGGNSGDVNDGNEGDGDETSGDDETGDEVDNEGDNKTDVDKPSKKSKSFIREGETAIFWMPAIGGKKYPIYEDEIEHWKELYPAVDVNQAIRTMIGWLEGSTSRLKTMGGMKRFINGWLGRSQDSSHQTTQGNLPTKQTDAPHSPEFLELWKKYPKKVCQEDAWMAWQTMNQNGKLPALEVMLNAVQEQNSWENYWTDTQFIPKLSDWIKGGRWADEQPVEKKQRYVIN